MPGLVADYPGLDVHGVVADFERAPRPAAHRRPAAGGVPRRHHRQLRARRSGPPSSPRWRGTLAPGRRAAARHRPGQGPGAPGAGPTTTRPASPPTFNLNVLRVVNRELGADFDVDALRARRGVGRASSEWIEMRLRSPATQTGRRPAARPERRLRGRRGDAHRDLREVPPGPGRGRAHRGRAALAHWWTDDAGRLRALARHGLSPRQQGRERGRRTPEVRPAPPPSDSQALLVRRAARSGLWVP